MKAKVICGFAFVLLCSVAPAQESSTIAVKKAELNTGVVIVDISKAGRVYELQCNAGVPGCVALKPGKYQMLELPKNRGMYDCKDVEVYPETTTNPEPNGSDKIGEYCMVESK